MEIQARGLDGIAVLVLKGKVTKGESEAQLRDRILDLVEGGRKRLIVDLAGVSYMDSSGLGELVRCYTTTRREGGRMALVGLNRRLVDLLRVTKLEDVFEVYESEADAARAFSA